MVEGLATYAFNTPLFSAVAHASLNTLNIPWQLERSLFRSLKLALLVGGELQSQQFINLFPFTAAGFEAYGLTQNSGCECLAAQA